MNPRAPKGDRTVSARYATVVVLIAVTLAGCVPRSRDEGARACAWMLWSASPGPPSLDPYRVIVFFPRAAYDTHNQCEEARTQHEHEQKQEERKKPELVSTDLCLPDTVDPRGPKGSGR
jgi:hypothetical protein